MTNDAVGNFVEVRAYYWIDLNFKNCSRTSFIALQKLESRIFLSWLINESVNHLYMGIWCPLGYARILRQKIAGLIPLPESWKSRPDWAWNFVLLCSLLRSGSGFQLDHTTFDQSWALNAGNRLTNVSSPQCIYKCDCPTVIASNW